MSSVNGRLVTCDICGESVFLKCTGEGETDGGYTRWNKFEEAVGWSHRCYEYEDICPSCTERISNAVKDEIAEIKRAKHSVADDVRRDVSNTDAELATVSVYAKLMDNTY